MIDPKAILIEILRNHHDSEKWVGAPFEAIKRVSNSKVGSVGQEFLEKLCKKFGYVCEFPENKKGEKAKQSPWDIKLENIEFELKTATEDVSGMFQFNHIRYHRAYDALICLGISPADIYFGVWSKADLTTGKAGNLVSMEKEANASYKLSKKASSLHPIEKFKDQFKAFVQEYNRR